MADKQSSDQNSAGARLAAYVSLFSGGSLQNSIKQNAYAYDASRMDWQQEKDNLTLNVILAYLQVLNNEDLLTSAIRQKELSAKQLDRLDVLDKQGAIAPSQASDVKGQLLNDELTILTLGNSLETAKLALAQLMNVPYSKSISLERLCQKQRGRLSNIPATIFFNQSSRSAPEKF